MSSDQTITLSGSATGTVREPTPSERLLQAEVARLRAALARIEQAQATAHALPALLALPEPDLLTESKIDDPIGAGTYYRADTVVRLLQKARNDRLNGGRRPSV